jgi:hypothetical protein
MSGSAKRVDKNIGDNETDFGSVLDGIREEMEEEIANATGDFKSVAEDLRNQVLQLGEMAKEAGENTQEVQTKTAALKQDLDAFEEKFGKLGERFGAIVNGGLKKIPFLPL